MSLEGKSLIKKWHYAICNNRKIKEKRLRKGICPLEKAEKKKKNKPQDRLGQILERQKVLVDKGKRQRIQFIWTHARNTAGFGKKEQVYQ